MGRTDHKLHVGHTVNAPSNRSSLRNSVYSSISSIHDGAHSISAAIQHYSALTDKVVGTAFDKACHYWDAGFKFVDRVLGIDNGIDQIDNNRAESNLDGKKLEHVRRNGEYSENQSA
jgi:hypothetical protein